VIAKRKSAARPTTVIYLTPQLDAWEDEVPDEFQDARRLTLPSRIVPPVPRNPPVPRSS